MKNKHLLDYLIARLQQEWSWQLLTILLENLMFAQTKFFGVYNFSKNKKLILSLKNCLHEAFQDFWFINLIKVIAFL